MLLSNFFSSFANLSQFLDDLVSRGVVGGIEAGRKLRAAIEEYHRTNASSRPDDRILIQVYANLRGLGKACHQAKITREESSFADFTAGFGSSNALTSFIDAGPQKEAADSKIRGMFEVGKPADNI